MFSEKDIERAEWASEMAQQVKVLATNPDDLSSIPRTHLRRNKLTSTTWLLTSYTFRPVHMCAHTHACNMHTHRYIYTHAYKYIYIHSKHTNAHAITYTYMPTHVHIHKCKKKKKQQENSPDIPEISARGGLTLMLWPVSLTTRC